MVVLKRNPKTFHEIEERNHSFSRRAIAIICIMSAAEIIKALPKLTEAERREVGRKLAELAEESEEVALCNDAGLQGAMVPDRMVEEDARRKWRCACQSAQKRL